jgi:hypothetical protein
VSDTIDRAPTTAGPWRGRPKRSTLGLAIQSPLSAAQRAFVRRCQKHGIAEPPDVDVPFSFSPWQGGRTDCVHAGQRGTGCGHCGAARQVWHFAWVFSGFIVLEVADSLSPDAYARLNAAVYHGYCVVFASPAQVASGTVFDTIKRALTTEGEQS